MPIGVLALSGNLSRLLVLLAAALLVACSSAQLRPGAPPESGEAGRSTASPDQTAGSLAAPSATKALIQAASPAPTTAATASTPGTPEPTIELRGEFLALARLKELTGRACSQTSSAYPVLTADEIEALVREADGPGNWVQPGKTWAGNLDSAMVAFGVAEILEPMGESAWVIRYVGDYPQALLISEYQAPSGSVVTIAREEIHVCGDPSWEADGEEASGSLPPLRTRPPAP